MDLGQLVPDKLNILAWRICHRKLHILENLAMFGISSLSLCKIYNVCLDNEERVFLSCPKIKDVWNALRIQWKRLPSTCPSIDVLLENASKKSTGFDALYESIILVFIWLYGDFIITRYTNHILNLTWSCKRGVQTISYLDKLQDKRKTDVSTEQVVVAILYKNVLIKSFIQKSLIILEGILIKSEKFFLTEKSYYFEKNHIICHFLLQYKKKFR